MCKSLHSRPLRYYQELERLGTVPNLILCLLLWRVDAFRRIERPGNCLTCGLDPRSAWEGAGASPVRAPGAESPARTAHSKNLSVAVQSQSSLDCPVCPLTVLRLWQRAPSVRYAALWRDLCLADIPAAGKAPPEKQAGSQTSDILEQIPRRADRDFEYMLRHVLDPEAWC